MLTATSWSAALVNSEPGLLILPREWNADSTTPAVLFCHGYGSNELINDNNAIAVINTIVNEGFPVLSCYLGGNTWGNDSCMTRMDAAFNYLVNTVKAHPSKLGIIGRSMGHVAAMNYANKHRSRVKWVLSCMGVCDLADMHTETSSGIPGSIDAAYPAGVGTWDTETYNPIVNAASKFSKIPWMGWHGDADTTARTATAVAFAGAIGGDLHVVPGDHSWAQAATWDLAAIGGFVQEYFKR